MSTITGTAGADGTSSLAHRIRILLKKEQPVKTAAWTVSKADVNVTMHSNIAGAHAITLPSDANDLDIVIGHWGFVYFQGAGTGTFTAGSGATVVKAQPTLKSLGQFAMCRWEKVAANTYQVSGDLALS